MVQEHRGTNLKQFEAISTLELDHALQNDSPNNELSFELHFLVQTIGISLQNDAM
jgi:hypothetical protein